MNKKSYHDILDSVANDSLSRNTNLWPKISAQLKRKSLMFTLRTRPVVAVLIALFILLTLSGVAYALGRAFGYIPGVGLVDQSAPLHVLELPVSQTRDGITITIKSAVLSSDKTIITLAIENPPFEKLWSLEKNVCKSDPELYLPDKTSLQVKGGVGNQTGTGYEYRYTFAPVPDDVNTATLRIPCIGGAATGSLPENWELSLNFSPAPPDMTVFPVIEITPSSLPVSETNDTAANPLTITKVIDASDKYILIGHLQPPPAPSQQSDSGVETLVVTDANGQDVLYDFPQDIDLPPQTSPTDEVWALEINKDFVAPLYIAFAKEYILDDPSQETVDFEFDAGKNPQEGQVWQLDKEFQLAGRQFTLDSIMALPNSYEFNFASSDHNIYSVGVDIPDYPPDIQGGGMDANAMGVTGLWSVNAGPYSKLPHGKLKVTLSHLSLIGETRNWTIDWQP